MLVLIINSDKYFIKTHIKKSVVNKKTCLQSFYFYPKKERYRPSVYQLYRFNFMLSLKKFVKCTRTNPSPKFMQNPHFMCSVLKPKKRFGVKV